jgi:ribosome-associated protein
MLVINERIHIPESEFSFTFVRSGGPGGQNVNKVASKAVLRWGVDASPSLPADVKARLRARQRRRITTAGDLVLTSQRYRDQDRNRQDCLDKLRAFVREAAVVPRARKKTKPSRAAHERRLADKRRRSAAKSVRRRPADDT